MSDSILETFTSGNPPVLQEAPQRMWPTVLLAASITSVVSVLVGILIADSVTVLQVLFVVACIISAVAAATWFGHREANRGRR